MQKEAVLTSPRRPVDTALDGVVQKFNKFNHLDGFEYPSDGTYIERRAWYSINGLLGSHESYARDNGVTEYVQQRLNFLSGGEKAKVVVVHDDDLEAFATPGYVVVSDGLLKLVEYEEELDALLAHEWVHLDKEHAHNHNKDGSVVGSIGRSRVHETEADLAAFELLDRKEINVRGMISLFGKMDQYMKEKAEEEASKKPRRNKGASVIVGDVTHGSLMDRRLNIEELLWLMDVRNISSEELTPLGLEQANFETYQRDSELWENYNELDTLSKRHFIQRQFKKIENRDEDRVSLTTKDLAQLQRDLIIASSVPSATEQEIDDLTELSLKCSYNVLSSSSTGVSSDSVERILDFFKGVNHPVFRDLGMSLDRSAVGDLGDTILTQFLAKNDVDVDNYGEVVKQVSTIWEDPDFAWRPILAHTLRNGTLEGLENKGWADYIEQSEGRIDDMFDYLFRDEVKMFNQKLDLRGGVAVNDRTVDELAGGVVAYVARNADWTDPVNNAKVRFLKYIATKRLATAASISDPIDFFKYLDRYNHDGFGIPDELSYHREMGPAEAKLARLSQEYIDARTEVRKKRLKARIDELDKSLRQEHDYTGKDPTKPLAEGMARRYSITQLVDKLKEYAESNKLSKDDRRWLHAIVHEYISDPYLSQGHPVFREERKLDKQSINDLLFLWAVGFDKSWYLSAVNTEVRCRTKKIRSTQDVTSLIDAVRDVPQRAKDMGFYVDWEISNYDLESSGSLMNLALERFLASAAHNNDTQVLVDAISQYPLPSISPERFESIEKYNEALVKWDKLVRNLLKKTSTEDREQMLVQLFTLGLIAENTQVNLQVATGAMEQVVQTLPFYEACDLVFVRFAHLPQYAFSKAVEHLIEQKARTPDEFEYLEKMLRKNIEGFISKDEVIGKLSLVDSLLFDNYAAVENTDRKVDIKRDEVRGLESFRLLQSMLETAHGDKELQNYIFERWWLYHRTSKTKIRIDDGEILDERADVVEPFKIEELAVWYYPPSKEPRLRFWVDELPPQGSYKPFTEVGQNVYLSSTGVKYYLLRKMLLGEKGVLTTEEDRKKAIGIIENTWIDFGDSEDAQRVVHELLTALGTVTEPEELYQRINPVLLDLILRLPTKTSKYSSGEVASEVAKKELARMKEQGLLTRPVGEREHQYLTRKIHRLMTAGAKEDTGEITSTTTRLLSLFTDASTDRQLDRFSPLDLALTVGEKSGAVGVRMLQLGGQYFDIPESDRERFTDVYDAMKGQSRLQAYRVLKREAETVPEIATLMDDIVEIGPRIGGGSLMTVYEVTLKNGEKEAVAIRNPNVKYHVDKVIRVLQKTLKEVGEKDPNNTNYLLAQVLLLDVAEWITNELDDPTFEEKDIRFHGENDTTRGNFSPGRSKYNILVPDSTPTGTRWVRREKFIDGKNLTGLELIDGESDISEGKINSEDYKQAISLLVRNYIYQLTETGLVHSDIHPGNFRITSDNASIAVFDRYNMLELNTDEQSLIKSLIPAIAVGGVQSAVASTVDYLFDLENNRNFQSSKEDVVAEIIQSGNGDLERSVMGLSTNSINRMRTY